MLEDFLSLFEQEVFLQTLDILVRSWPIWLPVLSLNIAFHLWLDYIRRLWMNEQGSVLLEIKIPKDVPKTPAGMEFVFDGLWEPAALSTPADTFWEGKLRDWFSLEIVSIGGEVKFFIWSLPRWKKIIESRIYAQYPGAQVVEVKDYALDLVYDPEKFSYWGITTKLNKPDAYPIKTYIDYQLDKTKLKEQEEAVDPLTPLIEYLGTLKSGEIAGIQIMIQAHRKEGLLDAKLLLKPDWKGGIKDEIKKIIEEESFIKPEEGKSQSMMTLSESQKDTIKSIERNAGKLAFDAMMRMLYVAPKDDYEKTRGMGLIGSTRQFGTHNLNGIRPDKFMSITHAWQDFNDIMKRKLQRTHLNAYKRRSFFNIPYKNLNGKSYILTTEELATLFHLPGAMATTPTLSRAPSKKAEAPANLPI
ncbi:MAG: hypothetical protein HYT69_02000 [Candidatus Zambryskibacteria bacterium]|nr:hypothetical protein [Candidatus Zambryskibacteria bacterium]